MALPGYPGLEVRGAPSSPKGRTLHATKDFVPGALIATLGAPLVVMPDAARQRDICGHCLAHGPSMRACTGCRAVAYCGPACQRPDWGLVHSKECRVFRRVTAQGNDVLPTTVRALVQVLLRPDVKKAVMELEGNEARFRADGRVWGDMSLHVMGAVNFAGLGMSPQTITEAEGLMCRVSDV